MVSEYATSRTGVLHSLCTSRTNPDSSDAYPDPSCYKQRYDRDRLELIDHSHHRLLRIHLNESMLLTALARETLP